MIRAFILQFLLVVPACLAIGHAADQELTALPNCALIATEWADGDSFLTLNGHTHQRRWQKHHKTNGKI